MTPERWALAGQVVRYLVTGGIVTIVQAAIYWTLAEPLAVHPQMANLCGYVAAVMLGYWLHGRVTFRGHAATGRSTARMARFAAVSLVSLGLNALWVALCTGWMGWPDWTPIPPMVLVTPALIFTLNRQWVFR